MLERVDYEATEAVEAGLDELINRRSASQEEANRIEALWKASERRHRERRREESAAAWRSYHLAQAERLERTAAELAASHRARAEALLEDGAGGEAMV